MCLTIISNVYHGCHHSKIRRRETRGERKALEWHNFFNITAVVMKERKKEKECFNIVSHIMELCTA
jgi:hypothetical protein